MNYSNIYNEIHTKAWGRYNDQLDALALVAPISKFISASNSNHVIYPMSIVKIIFHDPATIIIWGDGSKTVVKCHNEPFDREKGLAMCYMKKFLGENFHRTLRKCEGDCKEICL